MSEDFEIDDLIAELDKAKKKKKKPTNLALKWYWKNLLVLKHWPKPSTS